MAGLIDRKHWIAAAASAVAAAVHSGAVLAAGDARISADADPVAVQRALLRAVLAFDDPAFPPITVEAIEARVTTLGNPLAHPRYRAGLAAFDRAARARTGVPFAMLSLHAARGEIQRWIDSEDPARQQFAASIKRLAMVALYSDPKAWPAIGYDGPFDQRLK